MDHRTPGLARLARQATDAGLRRWRSAEHLPWWRRFSAPTGALVCADEQARAWLAELPHDQVLPSDRPRRARTRRGRWLVCHASSLREARGFLGRQPESC